MGNGKENRNFTTGNLLKKIILYMVPLFFANALQLLFTSIDIFTVRQFGNGNISSGAIGSTSNLLNLIVSIFWGLTSGASVVIANAKGAKDIEKTNKAMGNAVLLVLIAGAFIMFFGVFFSKPLLIALETDPIYLKGATTYLVIYLLGAPLNLLYNQGAAILRSFGDTKRPFVAVVISGVINIVLDFVFVYFGELDVAGVALATIMSQGIAMIIVFYFLMKDKRLFTNFKISQMKFSKAEYKEILYLGISSGLQSFIFNFTNVFVQKSINELGTAAVLGKAAGSNIDCYEYALLNSISSTALIAVGQNYGAKEKDRIKKSLTYCLLLEVIIVTVFDAILFALHRPLSLLTIVEGQEGSEEAIRYCYETMICIGLPYALCGIAECFSSYLRAMKYSITPTLVSLLTIVGSRMIIILFIFKLDQFHNLFSLLLAYPISWLLCCLVYLPFLFVLSKKKFTEIDNVKKESLDINA